MPDRVNFKAIAESIDIYDVAEHLGLSIVKDRAKCPVCDTDRALELIAETNSFRCHHCPPREPHHKCFTGDCITLYAHINGMKGSYPAAVKLQELFLTRTAPVTAPQKPAGRSQPAAPSKEAPAAPKKEAPFDPVAFAAKLVFTDEVAAQGLIEEDATRLGIGWHPQRKAVYFPQKDDTGFVCGFIAFKDGQLKMPPRWLQQTNVVRLRKA
jgi:hypothetical protein